MSLELLNKLDSVLREHYQAQQSALFVPALGPALPDGKGAKSANELRLTDEVAELRRQLTAAEKSANGRAGAEKRIRELELICENMMNGNTDATIAALNEKISQARSVQSGLQRKCDALIKKLGSYDTADNIDKLKQYAREQYDQCEMLRAREASMQELIRRQNDLINKLGGKTIDMRPTQPTHGVGAGGLLLSQKEFQEWDKQ